MKEFAKDGEMAPDAAQASVQPENVDVERIVRCFLRRKKRRKAKICDWLGRRLGFVCRANRRESPAESSAKK